MLTDDSKDSIGGDTGDRIILVQSLTTQHLVLQAGANLFANGNTITVNGQLTMHTGSKIIGGCAVRTDAIGPTADVACGITLFAGGAATLSALTVKINGDIKLSPGAVLCAWGGAATTTSIETPTRHLTHCSAAVHSDGSCDDGIRRPDALTREMLACASIHAMKHPKLGGWIVQEVDSGTKM